MVNNFQEKVSFIWSVADLLRGDYKQSEYGRVILPLTVLRRLDCVLEPTKEKVLAKAKSLPKKADEAMKDLMLCKAAGRGMTFYNTSKFVLQPTDVAKGKKFSSLLSDQDQLAANLTNYIAGFSENAREIFLTSSSSENRSTGSTKQTSSTSSSVSSSRSTSILMWWTTSRWATSSRNSSGDFRKRPTRRPVNTSRPVKSSD